MMPGPCRLAVLEEPLERDVRRVMGAWLMFLLLVGPDAVRLFTDRRVPDLRAPAEPTAAAERPAAKQTGRRRSTPHAVPADFRLYPLRFLSAAPPDSLVLLPGIGPVLAARIADARTGKSPYTNWNDLLAVRGIGPKTVERLRSLVTP